VSEDLFVSLDEIRVNYSFRNETAKPVSTTVVFPFPAIDLSEGATSANWNFPQWESEEFLDFKVAVNGRSVPWKLERRAFFRGQEVTDVVRAAGMLNLAPWKTGGWPDQMADARPEAVAELKRRGLLAEGEDSQTDPQWTLALKAYWSQLFLPGEEVRVTHAYRPFVGTAIIGPPSEVDGKAPVARLWQTVTGETDRYCIDEPTRRALDALERKNPDATFVTAELEYILKTAANWRGPVGRFRMTLDKGEPQNILSLCWSGLKKTGPTTFVYEAKSWVPERDLKLLVFMTGG